MATIASTERPAAVGNGIRDAAIALAATLGLLAFHAVRGWPTLSDSGGDNDSLLRLVEVRDLLAGQGWFDLTQYRMGLDGGFVMHWSRLVDLPIAILVASLGEQAALVAWPLLLFGMSLWLMLGISRRLAASSGLADHVVLPAAVIGGLALYHVGIFTPGALDHHNVQLALALATALAILSGRESAGAGLVAGAGAMLMLAVGMETAPYAAAACAVVALHSLGDEASRRLARNFGLAFGGVAVAVMAATVDPAGWLVAHCDAFSAAQASLAILGGFGLAAAASLPITNRWTRLAALGAIGAATAALAAAAFPQCLSDPYAGLDPRLKQFWLSGVTEAQSFASLLGTDLSMFASYYATPLVALALVAWLWLRGRLEHETIVIGIFLVAAVAVSFWQVRGAMFSIPFAAMILAAWVAERRADAAAAPRALAQLGMVAAWLASFGIVWQLAATPLAGMRSGGPDKAATSADPASRCYARQDYETLARQPQGTVLAISNLGSPILRSTHHRTLSGPYHRNVEGNLAALDMLMGDPVTAGTQARELGIDYVLVCAGNSETAAIGRWAPDGLLAGLVAAEKPEWLDEVASPDDARLVIYRVVAR